jgi:hypothetical protein
MWKYIIIYFTKWWFTAVSFIASFFLFMMGLTLIQRELFFEITIDLMLLSLLFIFISAIVQLFKKKWLTGIIQIIITVLIVNRLSFFLLYLPNDFYANGLELPANVKLQSPIDFKNGVQDEIAIQNSMPHNLKFLIANFGQPGMYKYYLWFAPIEDGTVYLKAFEITENDPLSAERLKARTSVLVNPADLTLYSKDFTIYEGDWGQPYGARIEVWFKPSNGKADYRLIQKNYKVEGWMR